MGYYLETPRPKDKVDQLVKLFTARVVTMEAALDAIFAGTKAVICVWRNLNFDSAAYCYDLAEFRRMNYVDDPRPRTWMLIDNKELVEQLTGYAEDEATIA